VLRGVQEPQILHLPAGVVSLDEATEAIELAESCGLVLDPSQCITLEAGMGQRSDRKWAAFEVCDVEPRQSGKNDTVAVRELHGLFLDDDVRLMLHTAHEAATVNEAFLRMESLISNNSELRAQVARFRYGNGDHAVELHNDDRLVYKTRTGGAARGFAGVSLLVYDEALFLQAKHVSASLAILARGRNRGHNPQMWAMSSAGKATSTFLWEIRRRALSGKGGRLAYVEHTAERIKLTSDGKLVSNGDTLDLEDRELWALANPAMNHPEHGISEEFIESEKRAQSADPVGWARERLGVFDPLPGTGAGREISVFLWNDVADRLSQIESRLVVAVDVAPDAVSSSIAVAGVREDGRGHVEVVEAALGTRWVADRLEGVIGRHEPLAVAVDAAGPVQQLVPELEAVCKAADVKFVKVPARAYAAACGEFVQAVKDKRVAHIGQGWLDDAVAGGRRRAYGDAWMWDRRVGVDITPLVAVTVARRVSIEVEDQQFFAGAYR